MFKCLDFALDRVLRDYLDTIGSFSSECNMANQNQPQILPIVAKPIVFKKPRSINVDLTRLNPLAKEQIPICKSYESKLNFVLHLT